MAYERAKYDEARQGREPESRQVASDIIQIWGWVVDPAELLKEHYKVGDFPVRDRADREVWIEVEGRDSGWRSGPFDFPDLHATWKFEYPECRSEVYFSVRYDLTAAFVTTVAYIKKCPKGRQTNRFREDELMHRILPDETFVHAYVKTDGLWGRVPLRHLWIY